MSQLGRFLCLSKSGLVIVSGIALVTLSDAALGQGGLPYTIAPPDGSVAFGRSVASGGDADGDGLPDIFAADSQYRVGARWSVYSGRDGSRLWGASRDFEFFDSVQAAFVGDVNGDDRDDLVVGYNVWFDGVRTLAMYSGADGALLFELDGLEITGVCAAGDVDGDLVPDFAHCEEGEEYLTYEVVVRSGVNGEILWRHNTGHSTSYSVRGLGDVDGDRVPDVVCLLGSAGGGQVAPVVEAFSGQTGAVIWRTESPTELGAINATLAAGTDLTGDGIGDAVVMSPFGQQGLVINGTSGAVVRAFDTPDIEGSRVKRLEFGDVNGDGRAEIFAVRWLDGQPGVDLLDQRGGIIPWAEGFGGSGSNRRGDYEVAIADVNGDGADDVILGSLNHGVRVFGGGRLLLNFAQRPSGYDVARGQTYDLAVAGGRPGRVMSVLGSLRGDGCTFVERLGICIDLDRPIYRIGSAMSDSHRVAHLRLRVPGSMPLGPLWLQATDPADPDRGPITSNVMQLRVIE